jgi:hypothetical protein
LGAASKTRGRLDLAVSEIETKTGKAGSSLIWVEKTPFEVQNRAHAIKSFLAKKTHFKLLLGRRQKGKSALLPVGTI